MLSRSHPLRRPAEPLVDGFLVSEDERILITGATGFIGSRVVEGLLRRGFRNLVCFARSSSKLQLAEKDLQHRYPEARIESYNGNLLSREDCNKACEDVAVIFHLAAATTAKSYPDAFLNSVVTTRNLLDANLDNRRLRRFVLVSSFAVYGNRQGARLLNETCPIDEQPELRGEAYCFAKVKQEQLVREYAANSRMPYVVIRPGSVYGDSHHGITGRVGIGTFGFFLHLGGGNKIPFTYVENCADAIILAGLVKGVDGEIFNVVDDDLPSSRQFLREYKKHVRQFKSLYVPHVLSRLLCNLWGRYSEWSQGQLPPAFNDRQWHAYWKRTEYTNAKLKEKLGWRPRVSTADALQQYFATCRQTDLYA